MAFIKCEECGKRYSDKASVCPFCKVSKITIAPQQTQETAHPQSSEHPPKIQRHPQKKATDVWDTKISITRIVLIFVVSFGLAGLYVGYDSHQRAEKRAIEQAEIEKKKERNKRGEEARQKSEISRAKREAEEQAKLNNPTYKNFGEKPTVTYNKKSCIEVEIYLKRILNDPDSLAMEGCAEPFLNKDGWIVGCEYRAKNALGGYVRKQGIFIVKHSRVISHSDF